MASKALVIGVIMMLVDKSISAAHYGNQTKAEEKVLSRRKRFLIFPTGSSFSVATCMTVGVYGNPQFSIWSWGLNYGFAYNLPTNATYFLNPPKDVLQFPFFENFEPESPPPPTTTTAEPETLPPDHDHHHHHDYDSGSAESVARPAPAGNSAAPPAAQRKYFVYYQPKYETKPMIQRRYRRDIYKNIESVIDKYLIKKGHSAN